MVNTKLCGVTWDHSRGFLPMAATAQRHVEMHPDVDDLHLPFHGRIAGKVVDVHCSFSQVNFWEVLMNLLRKSDKTTLRRKLNEKIGYATMDGACALFPE